VLEKETPESREYKLSAARIAELQEELGYWQNKKGMLWYLRKVKQANKELPICASTVPLKTTVTVNMHAVLQNGVLSFS
jgi:hypothetical protein